FLLFSFDIWGFSVRLLLNLRRSADGELCLSDVDPVSCETRGSDLELDDVVVLCPPGCRRTRMSVFGTGPYAAVSSVCGAALHR
uniref:LCCL domain-containing protein n=1 Tax=Oryzias latipes TaxID=8090 RepID=A0A3B3I6E5_ORYLA